MRRWLALGGAVALLGAVPAVAFALPQASSGGGSAPVKCQTTRWTSTPVTAPSAFAPISALTTTITAIYPVAITVSGVVQGQPVAFRVVDHWIQTQTAEPGTVPVSPAGGRATPFSFTWIAPGSAAAPRGHSLTLDWRKTGTGSATLLEADVAVTYTTDVCRGTG